MCYIEGVRAAWPYRFRLWPSARGFVGWGVGVLLAGATAFWASQGRRAAVLLPDSVQVEVNKADSLRLLSVPGMTPGIVSRLLYWRQSLGGFRELDELSLLIDTRRWEQAAPFLRVSPKGLADTVRWDLQTVDSATLVRVGFCRPRAAGRFVRYRAKRRGFRSWAELDSLQSLHPLERYRLRRWGLLTWQSASMWGWQFRPPFLDLNRATPAELEKLPGIGLYTAQRIVRYREKLRYFVSLDQLHEVWGLRPENLEKARPFLYVGSPLREPLRLREAPAKSLAAHPYISWKLARQLVRRRNAWGPSPIPPEVWKSWLPDSLRDRVEPYLTGD